MSNTHTHDQGMVMEQIYNLLMASIEPDLMTQNVNTLEAKYKGEDAEAHRTRLHRYQVALARYEERFAALMMQWKHDIESARDSLIAASKLA